MLATSAAAIIGLVLAIGVLAALITYIGMTGHGLFVRSQTSIAAWLDAHAAPEWRFAHRLWSVQLSLFWAFIGVLWVTFPAFQNLVSPFVLVLIGTFIAFLLVLARLTNQKGLPET